MKIIYLLLNKESVRILPFVPKSSRVFDIVSKIVFELKCNWESSVKHISASIYLANSWTSSRIFSPLFRKLRS